MGINYVDDILEEDDPARRRENLDRLIREGTPSELIAMTALSVLSEDDEIRHLALARADERNREDGESASKVVGLIRSWRRDGALISWPEPMNAEQAARAAEIEAAFLSGSPLAVAEEGPGTQGNTASSPRRTKKCDACSTEISVDEMHVIPGPVVCRAVISGFEPSRLEVGAAAQLRMRMLHDPERRKQLIVQAWRSAALKSHEADWGLCDTCHGELAAFKTAGRCIKCKTRPGDPVLYQYGVLNGQTKTIHGIDGVALCSQCVRRHRLGCAGLALALALASAAYAWWVFFTAGGKHFIDNHDAFGWAGLLAVPFGIVMLLGVYGFLTESAKSIAISLRKQHLEKMGFNFFR